MSLVKSIYQSQSIFDLTKKIDDYRFQKEITSTVSVSEPTPAEIGQLWTAAMLSVDDNISKTVEDKQSETRPSWACNSFEQWLAFSESFTDSKPVEQRDIIQLIATGLVAGRHTELRQILSKNPIKERFSRAWTDTAQWDSFLRSSLEKCLYLLCQQESHDDLQEVVSITENIRSLQPEHEMLWLSRQSHKERSALILLALYHVASATETLSKYLKDGTVTTPIGRQGNIENELSVLTSKALEYSDLCGDIELTSWINIFKSSFNQLRADTIWSNASNISGIIDSFLSILATKGKPVFSMLPSQQEALRKNFLDPQREAIILQMPTSSGKTLLAELAALSAISSYKDARVIYLTPTRALSTQVKRTLSSDFREIEIDVMAASSAFEEDPYELSLLKESSGVVVATPEKMDLMLRSHPDWFGKVRLLIVDEAHLLRDGERGVKLELLLTNFRREFPHVKMLLLTPFVENASELSNWLSEDRGAPVEVQWRPSRLVIGHATFPRKKTIEIEWKEPHRPQSSFSKTRIELNQNDKEKLKTSASNFNKSLIISSKLKNIGPVLGMYPRSRSDAEDAAADFASDLEEINLSESTPEHRVAVALAEADYGKDSILAFCLKRGVSYHHSALSSELRYLIERLAAGRKISFLAATTTLAQGMNFPVSSVVIHSVSKPNNGGKLTPSEFWNIAGRAGRVGLSERGFIVFSGKDQREDWANYTDKLSDKIKSALEHALKEINYSDSLKWIYRTHESVRPFMQYLSHASATLGVGGAYSDLERLIDASFSGQSNSAKASMTKLAQKYLSDISQKPQGYLKVADKTGLGSYSFDELFAHIREDDILLNGSPDTLSSKQGLKHLVDALINLPELSLGLDRGHGPVNTEVVAKIVHQWMSGSSIQNIASEFDGESEAKRIREAGTYVFSKVSQIVSWGAHAYLSGRSIASRNASDPSENLLAHRLLPAYIQHGVNTPESLVASLIGVPRAMTSGVADAYTESFGPITIENASSFRKRLEQADAKFWALSVDRSRLSGKVSGYDLRSVWRESQGLHE